MIETHYRLSCDNCETAFDPPGAARTPHELRLMAAFAAWSCHKRDLCWGCQRYSGYTLSGRAIQRQDRWRAIITAFHAQPDGYKRHELQRAPECAGVPLADIDDLWRIGLLLGDDPYDPTLRLAPQEQWPTWVRALVCTDGKPPWFDALRAWDDTR